MTTPAANVIKKCGGAAEVAKMADVHVSRVHRWTYPKARGGTDGRIPTKHQQILLDKAREQGIDLATTDFFEDAAANETDEAKAS